MSLALPRYAMQKGEAFMPLLMPVLMLWKAAGSRSETTTDSFQSADRFLGIHSLDEFGNTLCISGAAALEFHVVNLSCIVNIK